MVVRLTDAYLDLLFFDLKAAMKGQLLGATRRAGVEALLLLQPAAFQVNLVLLGSLPPNHMHIHQPAPAWGMSHLSNALLSYLCSIFLSALASDAGLHAAAQCSACMPWQHAIPD